MRRTTFTWIPVGGALFLGLIALIVMFGFLNYPIKAVLESRLSDTLGAEVTVESLEGNPFYDVSLSRVEISDASKMAFACGEVAITYRPIGLLWGTFVVDSLRLESPRLIWRHTPGEGPGNRSLPAIDLKHVVVERGILTLQQDSTETVAEDLNFEVGFQNTSGEAMLQVNRLRTQVLEPPIRLTNLEGLVMSREDIVLLQEVVVSSPHSSVTVSGEIVGLANPHYRFDVAVDSLNLDEVNQVAGTDLPSAVVWLSGRAEGSRTSADLAFDWVVGGAAGDLKFGFSEVGDKWHTLTVRGREVDLARLLGVSIRGDFEIRADGTGLDVDAAIGQAVASVSNGSLYGMPIDSVAAEVRYEQGLVSGGLLLDGEVGTFYGSMRVDRDERFWMRGRLAGINLLHAGGPESVLAGDLSVTRHRERTTIGVDMDRVGLFGEDAGTISARLRLDEQGLVLERADWKDAPYGLALQVEGDCWRREDGLFDLNASGSWSPRVVLGGPEEMDSVAFQGRAWSEGLAYGATRRRADLTADLEGLFGLGEMRAEVSADGDRIRIESFRSDGANAVLTVSGESILGSAYDLHATYGSSSLDGIPTHLVAGGDGRMITATGSVVGAWEKPEVSANISADSLYVAGGSFVGLGADVNLPIDGVGGLSLNAQTASWGGRTLHDFFADFGQTDGETLFLIGSSESYENRLSIWGNAATSGDSLSVRVESALIQLQDEYLINKGPIALAHSRSDGLTIEHLYLAGPAGELEAVPPDETGGVNIRVNEFDLGPWAFLLGMNGRIEGELSGGVAVTLEDGQWATAATFEVANARIDSFGADVLYGDLTHQGDRLSGTVGARIGTGNVYLEGHAGIGADQEVDTRFGAEAVPLSALNGFWPQIDDIDGELSGQVWITGPSNDVHVNGDLVASSGEFHIPSLNRGLNKVSLEVDVSPGLLTFTTFSGTGITGDLAAAGTIDLSPLDLSKLSTDPVFGSLDLEITATTLDASGTPDIQATIDGTVRITGSLDSPKLSGRVDLQKAEIRLLSMLQAPPDPESIWRVVPFFRNLQMDLTLAAARQLWVRDDLVNVELAGDLDIIRDLEDIAERRADELGFRFFGSMNSLRGTYRFQNRTFRIWREEGEGGIVFDGERSAGPQIDMKAWARIPTVEPAGAEGEVTRGEIDITVLATGSFEKPELLLVQGRPDAEEDFDLAVDETRQAELLSYILFGRNPDLLIAAEQSLLGEQSTGLILGMATRELQSRIAESLNLDLVQVEMGSASTIDRVTVGKYIGDRLFVTYEDQIGQGREFGVEYQLLPRFSLESRFEETPDGQVQPSLRFTWGKDW